MGVSLSTARRGGHGPRQRPWGRRSSGRSLRRREEQWPRPFRRRMDSARVHSRSLGDGAPFERPLSLLVCQSDAIESAMNAPPQAVARSSSASASVTRRNAALSGSTEVTGHVLLALLFLLSCVGKLGAYSATCRRYI